MQWRHREEKTHSPARRQRQCALLRDPSGDPAPERTCRRSASLALYPACRATSTVFVLACPVWTQTYLPSDETRSIHGRLPFGKLTVPTIERLTRSIFETLSRLVL